MLVEIERSTGSRQGEQREMEGSELKVTEKRREREKDAALRRRSETNSGKRDVSRSRGGIRGQPRRRKREREGRGSE